ncbi:MAG: GNAT family N-acetyltransferase [bacterium]|nr:GNAT family N-acetyltransferase [bacterium]
MIEIKTTKQFLKKDLFELFNASNWDSAKYTTILKTAFKNSSNVISAWDNEKLVGIIRDLDDKVWNANIDCLLIHPEYRRNGIGTKLLTTMLDLLKNIQYITIAPNERETFAFYEKFGFKEVSSGCCLQLSNIEK